MISVGKEACVEDLLWVFHPIPSDLLCDIGASRDNNKGLLGSGKSHVLLGQEA